MKILVIIIEDSNILILIKCDTISITKFEKDIEVNPGRKITYQFYNTFPKSMTSIPVSYGAADLLKVNVSFNYDRYVVKV